MGNSNGGENIRANAIRLSVFTFFFLFLFGARAGSAAAFVWDCSTNFPPEITVSDAGSGHEISWDCGAERSAPAKLKGYEVRYRGESQNLTFGATGFSWLDNIVGDRVLDDYTARCTPSNYEVRAVTKGNKHQSQWVKARAEWVNNVQPEYCNSGGGGGGGGGGNNLVCAGTILELGRVTDFFGSDPTVPSCEGQIKTLPFLSTMRMVWEDNFDYANMDELIVGDNFITSHGKWDTSIIVNGETQYYVDEIGGISIPGWSPFVFGADTATNGVIAIQAAPYDLLNTSLPVTDQDEPPKFASGILTTYGKHTINPGTYVEVRARLPYGRGTFPAIWLYDQRNGGVQELDIMEYYGQSYDGSVWSEPMFGDPGTWETIYNTYHDENGNQYQTWVNSNEAQTPEWCGEAVRFPDEFHTFGLLYTKSEVIWYVDGVQTMRMVPRRGSDGDADVKVRRMPTAGMYLILNLAMDASWFNKKSDDSTCSHFNVGGENQVNMAIDYVRVYQ